MSGDRGNTSYLVVAGELVLLGKEPDGDSVRFRPADSALLAGLDHGERLRVSSDGTVQLRFDGVDAPELHYSGVAQPQGASARDALLAYLGFTDLAYSGTTVTAATPATVPAVVLARMVEVNGRPVALLCSGDPAQALTAASGQWQDVTPELLRGTVNFWLLSTGVVYPLLYTSTAAVLRDALCTAAASARAAALGVWTADSSAQVRLAEQADLGPTGALIYPKLFRRATDYLRDRGDSGQTLPKWLQANAATEDDDVVVAGADPVPLHTLLSQTDDTVSFLPDLLDLVFVER